MILVPTAFPPEYGKVYLTISHPAPGAASITIGAYPNCNGTACEFATVDEGPGVLDKTGRHAVKLKDGNTAWFERHKCGANCAGSETLVFKRSGLLVTIGVKGGGMADTVRIANGLKAR